jgi:hypothetical protein
MLRAPWLCLLAILVSLSTLRLAARDPMALLRSPEQIAFFRPAGHSWIFFHKRAKIFWLEDSEHSVFSATEQNPIRLFLQSLLHPYSHHSQPWSGARRNLALKDDGLSAFAIASDGETYFVFSDRIESRKNGEAHLLLSADMSGVASVAVSANTVFISDKAANQLLAIDRRTGTTLRINHHGDVPDRLVASGLYLYGMNYSERKLVRYSLLPGIISSLLRDSLTGVSVPHAAITVPENSPVGGTSEALTVESLDAAEDFAVYADTVYVLEPLKSKLTALSFHGGGVHSTNIDGLLGDVRALAASEAGLVFSDHRTKTFDVLSGVIPATLYTAEPNVATDIGVLYTYQYRRKLLPYKMVSVANRDDLSKLMQNLYLQGEGKKVFCLLNQSKHKNCEQDFQFPARLTIPDLSLEPYVTTTRMILSKNDVTQMTLGEIAKKNFTGSEAQLRSALVKFNSWYDGSDIMLEQKGRFELPITGVQAEGFVSSREKHPPTLLTEALSGDSMLQLPFSSSHATSQVRPLSQITARASDSERQQPNEDASWLKIIHASHASVPAQVAIVDFEFDLNHPLFKPDQFTLYSSNKGVSQEVYEDGQSSTGPDKPAQRITIEDHGTHIAGLIGGQEFGGTNYGVNAGATLQGVYVNDFLDAVTKRKFHIYNISLGENDVSLGYKLPRYTVQTKPNLQNWIEAIKNNPDALFIIAAGNENSSSLEKKLASIGDASNALTVMATDATGVNIWKESSSIGSNYGGPTVGIAAPGQKLTSGTYHGGWAIASGTSQATALVSGAASILRGKYSLQSWQIKDRMIATTKVDSWLQQNAKASLGGVLDVDRAVTYADRTVVYFRHGDTPCVGKFNEEQSRLGLMIEGEDYPIHFKDILRLHWDKTSSSFRIWYLIHTTKDDFQTSTQLPAELHRKEFGVAQISGKPEGNGKFSITFETLGDCSKAEQTITNVLDLYGGFYDPL